MIPEDGGTIKLPSMQCLPAQEASRNKYRCCTYVTTEALYIEKTVYKQIGIRVGTITEDGSTIKLPLMQCLPAQEASCDKYGYCTYTTTGVLYIGQTANTQQQIQIPVGTIMEDGSTTGTPAVCYLHAQEARRDGYTNMTYTEAGGTTGTPAVHYLHV